MTHTSEALKIALENDWKPKRLLNLELSKWSVEDIHAVYGTTDAYFLEPLFWQALGRGLGLTNNLWIGKMQRLVGDKLEIEDCELTYSEYKWHKFIDHLAANKSIESFFEEIIKTKK